jgi:hypothetical protein
LGQSVHATCYITIDASLLVDPVPQLVFLDNVVGELMRAAIARHNRSQGNMCWGNCGVAKQRKHVKQTAPTTHLPLIFRGLAPATSQSSNKSMIPPTCVTAINTMLRLAAGVPIAGGQGLTTKTRAAAPTKELDKKKPQTKTVVKTTKAGKTIFPPVSNNREGPLSCPKTLLVVVLSLPIPPPAVLTPEKLKQQLAVMAERKNVKDQRKKAKLERATQAKVALRITGQEAKAPLTLGQNYKTTMDCFKRYGHNYPEHLWIIDEKEAGEKVLEEALDPQQIEKAYIVVLNDDNHFLVVHTLTQLDTKLQLSNPVEGEDSRVCGEYTTRRHYSQPGDVRQGGHTV